MLWGGRSILLSQMPSYRPATTGSTNTSNTARIGDDQAIKCHKLHPDSRPFTYECLNIMSCQAVVVRANTHQLMRGDEPFAYEPLANLDESRPSRVFVALICSDEMHRLAARMSLCVRSTDMEPNQLVLIGRFLTRHSSLTLDHTRSQSVYRLLSDCILI